MTVAAVAFLTGVAFHAATTTGRASDPPGERPDVAADANDAVPAGPTRIVEGVPAGFARTEDGAVAAAASFVTTGQVLIDMDPLAADDAIRQMAATATADRQVTRTLTGLADLRDLLRSGTGPIVFRQSSLAARVDRFDTDRARVAVWSVGVLSREGIAAPQAGWQISTFELVWERDDWRIDEETIVAGPAPALDDSTVPATSAAFAAALDGFTALRASLHEDTAP